MNSLIECLQRWNKNPTTIILYNGSNVIGYNIILGEFYDYSQGYFQEVSQYIASECKIPLSKYIDLRNFPQESIKQDYILRTNLPDYTKETYVRKLREYYSQVVATIPTFLNKTSHYK